jgi:hypothetical protein
MSDQFLLPSKGSETAKCILVDVVDTASLCNSSSWWCCSTDARISSLEQQLQELQLSSEAGTKQSKEVEAWTAAAELHPAFQGKWLAHHKNSVHGITVSGTKVAFDWQGGKPQHVIERLAPYTFHLQHNTGHSLFVLLPCLNQMVEVNYKEGVRLLWVKKQ